MWARLGSNQGPVEYKSTALPTELRARNGQYIVLLLKMHRALAGKERVLQECMGKQVGVFCNYF